MGGLFGKHKKPVSRVTEQDKAVLQLKQQRDKLKQYQKRIEINLERDRQLAKKLLNEGKRDKAKLLLKKKRYQEQLLQNTDAQLEKLEQLTHDLEFAQIEIQVSKLPLIISSLSSLLDHILSIKWGDLPIFAITLLDII